MRICIYILAILLLVSPIASAQTFEHIDQLFELRSSIGDQGNLLPDAIKRSKGQDLRSLERIFELNTSALVTIEAYFRIFKMAYSQYDTLDKETVGMLNEWLGFIKNQCKYDALYLNEALKETRNKPIQDQILKSKTNVETLSKICDLGMDENNEMVSA